MGTKQLMFSIMAAAVCNEIGKVRTQHGKTEMKSAEYSNESGLCWKLQTSVVELYICNNPLHVLFHVHPVLEFEQNCITVVNISNLSCVMCSGILKSSCKKKGNEMLRLHYFDIVFVHKLKTNKFKPLSKTMFCMVLKE